MTFLPHTLSSHNGEDQQQHVAYFHAQECLKSNCCASMLKYWDHHLRFWFQFAWPKCISKQVTTFSHLFCYNLVHVEENTKLCKFWFLGTTNDIDHLQQRGSSKKCTIFEKDLHPNPLEIAKSLPYYYFYHLQYYLTCQEKPDVKVTHSLSELTDRKAK